MLLVDAGRFDPPSGWKVLLAPEPQGRGPRSVGDDENDDWLPVGGQSPRSGGNPSKKKIKKILTLTPNANVTFASHGPFLLRCTSYQSDPLFRDEN